MIDYFATPKLRTILPKVQAFLEQEIFPIEQSLLAMPFKEAEKILRELKPKVQAAGFWNPYHSEAEGGLGLTLMEVAQLCEILGASPFGLYVCNAQAPDAGNIELLLRYATPSMREAYLHPLLEGNLRSCFAMTEPDYAGSNPVKLGTMAVRDGDEYVINGHKWFTSSADGAAFAIVMAVTDADNPNPYQRASMIIVPTQSEGFEMIRNISVMGHAGEGWLSHSELKLNNVRVPVQNLIGGEGEGFKLAQQRLGPGRIHHCMRWIGICERAFGLMCSRAATRNMGDGTMLGEKQMVQQMIAESRAEINAARLMVLDTAWHIENHGDKAAANQISTIKFFVAGVLQRVLDRAIQVHGALGVTDDTILAFYYREERAARIYDGPDEAHKASLARKILKGYYK